MTYQLSYEELDGYAVKGGFPGGAVVKNPPANAGDARDADSIPESGRSPGGGNGKLLWHSCMEISPWTEEPAGLQFMELQGIRHN